MQDSHKSCMNVHTHPSRTPFDLRNLVRLVAASDGLLLLSPTGAILLARSSTTACTDVTAQPGAHRGNATYLFDRPDSTSDPLVLALRRRQGARRPIFTLLRHVPRFSCKRYSALILTRVSTAFTVKQRPRICGGLTIIPSRLA